MRSCELKKKLGKKTCFFHSLKSIFKIITIHDYPKSTEDSLGRYCQIAKPLEIIKTLQETVSTPILANCYTKPLHSLLLLMCTSRSTIVTESDKFPARWPLPGRHQHTETLRLHCWLYISSAVAFLSRCIPVYLTDNMVDCAWNDSRNFPSDFL